jgi:hypothetical protein
VTTESPDYIANRTFNNQDWTPYTIDDARKTTNPWVFYTVGKKEAEKAVWKFVAEEKPHFGVTVLLPCLIVGPTSHTDDIKQLDFANRLLHSYIDGNLERIPPTEYAFSYVSRAIIHSLDRSKFTFHTDRRARPGPRPCSCSHDSSGGEQAVLDRRLPLLCHDSH